ncbi:MAG: rod shape-determining protein MreC [Candidatus Moranbacteria bacterium RIFOXYA12_FULL_44_15]|nr:MAG: rod shape-determining protein MreC [Candidatus Moranbacteria bacterium RIFOXYA12_FULL_44_15]OGI36429.1 MAG: rod shape-determining protein MreC [Candidatus Moranbacteria bacterium RIFOXYA2_FULL_43_15]
MPKKYFTSKIIKITAIAAVCALLVFLNPRGIFGPVRGFFLTLAYPLQKISYLAGKKTSGAFSFLESISNLKDENKNLIRENDRLTAEAAGLQGQKRENEILREQLRLAPRDKFNLESALVIGQYPGGLGGWIIIDKGSAQGIAPGMAVIVSDGILVGKVEEAYWESSKINLLTDSSASISALDLETGAKGIVRGEYGLGLSMDMVAQTDTLNEGDTVVASGLGSGIPGGLYIGKIQKISVTEDKLFQKAQVVPKVRYSKLEIVFVVKNSQ